MKQHQAQALRYVFGGFLCLLTLLASQGGVPWYISTIMICAAIIIMVGQRQIIRPSVARTCDEIICHYIPWYEGTQYVILLVLPLLGVAAATAGLDPDNPHWLSYVGLLLLGVLPLMLWSAGHVWRRSFLRISPSALTLRSGMVGSKLIEIKREQIVSITPMIVTKGTSKSLQTEIAYHPVAGDSGETATVLLGLQLTVRPIDLANALTSWNDADVADPDELLNLIEQVLRGGRPAIPVKPPRDRSDHE